MVSIVCRNCPCAPAFLRVGQLIASHHVSATAIHRPMTAAGPDVQANPRRTPSVCDVRYLAGPEAIAANSHRHLPMLHAAAAAVRCGCCQMCVLFLRLMERICREENFPGNKRPFPIWLSPWNWVGDNTLQAQPFSQKRYTNGICALLSNAALLFWSPKPPMTSRDQYGLWNKRLKLWLTIVMVFFWHTRQRITEQWMCHHR